MLEQRDRWREVASIKKRIDTGALKVLDAPGIRDDYYSHLIDFSSNGLLGIALNRNFYWWERETGKIHGPVECPKAITAVCFTPGGKRVILGMKEGMVIECELESKQLSICCVQHRSQVNCVDVSEDYLITGGKDGIVFLKKRGKKKIILAPDVGPICGLTRQGNKLLIGGNANVAKIYDLDSLEEVSVFNEHKSAVRALAFHPQQADLIATGGGVNDQRIFLWNGRTGKPYASVDAGGQVISVRWSPDGKLLAAMVSDLSGEKFQVKVYRYFPNSTYLSPLELVVALDGHTDRTLGSAVTPDGVLITAGADETIMFWKVFPNIKRKPTTSSSLLDQSYYTIR